MSLDNIMVSLAKIAIDGTDVPNPVEIEWGGGLIQTEDVRSAGTGQDVLGKLVTGRSHTFKIRMQEPTVAYLTSALNVSSNVPPAIGATLAPHVVKITPFGDGDNTRTIKYHAVAFNGMPKALGNGAKYDWEIECTAMRALTGGDAGKVWSFAVA